MALRDLALLRRARPEHLHVSVDVTAEELTAALRDLVRTARSPRARTGVPADRDSEHSPLDAMPVVIEELRRCVISVSGWCSTTSDRLHAPRPHPGPPVDAVKIDRGFGQRTVESPVDHDIVQTIVGAAQRRDLMLMADGLASVEQADACVRLGCRQAQGPLFGPCRRGRAPLPAT
jgi:EAL domain-containing protein (putative c-di-GMP-specific phosphodiesterase class I)